jgi:SAM-dependent methyltransferase
MAHYAFYAEKTVSPQGAWINRTAAEKLSKIFLACLQNRPSAATATAGFRPPSVLEVGPGQGLFASFLINTGGVEYKGYEPEKTLFNALKAKGMNVVNTPVPPIPEDNERFAASALLNVLEHMPTIQAAEKLLQEICRILKPAGIVFIVVPSYLDWGRDFFNLDYTHQTIMTESRLRQMLNDAGFRILRMTYHYGCFFSGFGRIPNALARLSRLLMSVLLPRSAARRDTIQKMGILFAENIICCAEKVSPVKDLSDYTG